MRPRRRERAISKKVVARMSDLDENELECMAGEVQYHPSEFHKTLEALQRWNLSSPGRRRGKTACDDGVYEAKLTTAGLYHAFPLRGPSAFVGHLRIQWRERNV